MRLEGKVAVIIGAGQSPGEGIGNGRATTLRFAQEGARILAGCAISFIPMSGLASIALAASARRS
jgi:NAD(P)-dependent dehydrogenase (short-subunit alcohol dehydrogenase family)